MKKMVLKYCLIGFPIGLAIGFYISVFISAAVGDGAFYPCAPQFVEAMGSQLSAVVLQMTLCGVIGSAFSSASLIWRKEDWSLLKQTVFYFLITGGTMIPCAWAMYWMEHTAAGFLSYFGIFMGTFAVFWAAGYFTAKANVKKMNAKLDDMKKE